MTARPTDSDSAGHYAVLDIPANATAEEVTAAYRRAAKRLHPDVPRTGDRAGFLRLQEAYQVLGDPIRRAAYDQSARAIARPAWRQEEQPLAFVPAISWRLPRFLGLGLALLTVLALAQFGWRFVAPPPRAAASAPPVLVSASAPAPAVPGAVDAPADIAGSLPAAQAQGDHFVAPATSPAILWQRVPDRPGYQRAGQLPAFAVLFLLQPAGDDGMAEIRLGSGLAGFIEAARLLPGDAHAARQAACLYNAGAPPRGGSLLVRPAGGPVRVAVENREDRPAVFKLRAGERAAAAVYLAPRGKAEITDLPAGSYRAEFAVGDLWSAPCGRFMAGMRAQRVPDERDLTGPASFSISATVPAEDISDDAFSHE